MRHRKAGRQFGRDTSSRRAMLRNLAANLITHERIETTDAKAKELRRVAERLITKAMRLGKIAYTPQGELSAADKARRLHAERLVSSYVPRFGVKSDGSKIDIVEKVMVDLSKRFEGRPGGYTRIVKIGNRRGDNAPMSIIEFIDAAPIEDTSAPESPAQTITTAEPTGTESAATTASASTTESAATE
ncbi:50S ribosomal protein L17 [Polyangium aurulentum]|uniref:50S ribosomal protein L17 n=1 Tax=Polyangium aurulentum TaxID=2567896 RepID=UPI0010AE7592|nr:50S ribosomal protein L17 [Polyangium aurulentum]UQA61506.1 50S ribosomal protein L17 [Polyangium aurulentum]